MKKNMFLFMVSISLFLLSFVIIYPEKFGLCETLDRECIYPNAFNIGEPLLITAPILAFISFILFFTKPEVFKAWSKFAIFAIPLLVIFIISTPVQCSAALGMCLDKELASWASSIVFLILSLIVIFYKTLKLRALNN